jgi:DNA polymerase-1
VEDVKMKDAELTFVDSTDKLADFLTWMGQRHPCLAVDTETEGLDAWRDDIRLIQIGDATAGWAFPWHEWGGVALAAVTSYDGPVVFHNCKFDVTMIEEHSRNGYRFDWSRVHDTMIMGHLLDPTDSRALKNMCNRYVGSYASELQMMLANAMRENRWTWATVPINFPVYWGYACVDTVLTARLFEHVWSQIAAGYRHVYELEMQVARITMGMERRGARIDLDYCQHMVDELERYCEQARAWAEREHGVNIGSNPQVVARLQTFGVNLTKLTPGGAWALDEDVLDQLGMVDGPAGELVETVRTTRKAEKIKSTYFENFLRFNVDGLLHPTINQLGARTGRMSVTSPALQTLPRGTIVRDAFTARDGHVLFSADSDQIEMRLLAHFSQDQNLIEAILAGDLHTETARRVYQDPTIDKKDPRRQTAKNAGFAKVYMAGVAQFAKTAGISVEQAREFLDLYDQQFPGVRAFQHKVDRIARQRYEETGEAYVVAPSGRRHVVRNLDASYKMINYLIQGTAADVLKEQLVSLDMAGLSEFMILPVHDEVVFDIPVDLAEDARRTISEAMTDLDRWTVPITVGVDGPFERWGDKYR